MDDITPTTPTAPVAAKRPWYRRRATVFGAAGSALVIGAFAAGIPVGAATLSPTTTAAQTVPQQQDSSGSSSSGSAQQVSPFGSGTEQQQSTTSGSEASTTASTDEASGVVLVNTVLGYENAEAAGTGIVLTSDGLVLTNNHVVEGSTEITVTIGSTGQQYTATVVGTDAENDVAVLQLEGASGLTTATIDDDGDAAVGDDVTAVGNSEGGGVLMAADGTITDLDSTVTTQSESTVSSETLDGMIQISADVVSGDSGGPLLDDEGEVIGIDTAASSGSATTVAYAIPIDDALDIANQIVSGDESGSVTIGYPAFLGVQVSSETGMSAYGYQNGASVTGASVAGVIEGTPAADAGIAAGDVITSVDGVAVSSSDDLTQILASYDSGDQVTIAWTTAAGASQTATVTLADGPAA